MFSAALRVLRIKDLKDLSFFRSAGDYRHAGPKGPEEMFFTLARIPSVGQDRLIWPVLPGWKASPNYRGGPDAFR